MRFAAVILILFFYHVARAQDPWKNVYSRQAWTERDKWQRADELIGMLRISEASQVADVGCHEGYMTFKLARVVGKQGVVYAVDIAQNKLDKVKEYADQHGLVQVRPVKVEENNPKLPVGTLDAVMILDTYHEMDAHDEVLANIRKSLKKGGRLLICEPISDARRQLSRSEQERRHELALAFAVVDLEKAGFKIVFQKDAFIDRVAEKGDKMWVLIGEKK